MRVGAHITVSQVSSLLEILVLFKQLRLRLVYKMTFHFCLARAQLQICFQCFTLKVNTDFSTII
jgi:hypothetical protein